MSLVFRAIQLNASLIIVIAANDKQVWNGTKIPLWSDNKTKVEFFPEAAFISCYLREQCWQSKTIPTNLRSRLPVDLGRERLPIRDQDLIYESGWSLAFRFADRGMRHQGRNISSCRSLGIRGAQAGRLHASPSPTAGLSSKVASPQAAEAVCPEIPARHARLAPW